MKKLGLLEAYIAGNIAGRKEMLAIITARLPYFDQTVRRAIEATNTDLINSLNEMAQRCAEIDVAKAPKTLQRVLKDYIATIITEPSLRKVYERKEPKHKKKRKW